MNAIQYTILWLKFVIEKKVQCASVYTYIGIINVPKI